MSTNPFKPPKSRLNSPQVRMPVPTIRHSISICISAAMISATTVWLGDGFRVLAERPALLFEAETGAARTFMPFLWRRFWFFQVFFVAATLAWVQLYLIYCRFAGGIGLTHPIIWSLIAAPLSVGSYFLNIWLAADGTGNRLGGWSFNFLFDRILIMAAGGALAGFLSGRKLLTRVNVD